MTVANMSDVLQYGHIPAKYIFLSITAPQFLQLHSMVLLYSSIELNQKHIMDFILFDIFFAFMFVLIAFFCLKKLLLMSKAMSFDNTFIHSNKPMLNFSVLKGKNHAASLRKTIQNGYIKNCTIENHDGKMKISLEKKIVKDSCPSCGASITGAVNENYICPFCKNKIIKVIEKK